MIADAMVMEFFDDTLASLSEVTLGKLNLALLFLLEAKDPDELPARLPQVDPALLGVLVLFANVGLQMLDKYRELRRLRR